MAKQCNNKPLKPWFKQNVKMSQQYLTVLIFITGNRNLHSVLKKFVLRKKHVILFVNYFLICFVCTKIALFICCNFINCNKIFNKSHLIEMRCWILFEGKAEALANVNQQKKVEVYL